MTPYPFPHWVCFYIGDGTTLANFVCLCTCKLGKKCRTFCSHRAAVLMVYWNVFLDANWHAPYIWKPIDSGNCIELELFQNGVNRRQPKDGWYHRIKIGQQQFDEIFCPPGQEFLPEVKAISPRLDKCSDLDGECTDAEAEVQDGQGSYSDNEDNNSNDDDNTDSEHDGERHNVKVNS